MATPRRRYDPNAELNVFQDRTRPLREVIPAIAGRMGKQFSPLLTELTIEWERLVGQPVAGHTRPGRFDAGQTLVVFVDSAVWLSELNRGSRSVILARLQQQAGVDRVRGIRFVLDPDGPAAPGPRGSRR